MEEIDIDRPEADPDECKTLNKILKMMKDAEPWLLKYPKYTRFTRVADITRCMDRMMEIAITANRKYFKKNTLQELDVEVDKLRKYVRLSYDLKYISFKTYKLWTSEVDEIGRMLGGWIKSQSGKK